MFVSVAANVFVSRKLFQVGKETDSVALQADAWHLRTDVYTSLGVMGGLAAIFLGGLLHSGMDLHWVDPLAAIGVALLIIKTAFHLTIESARDLLDAGLPLQEDADIRKLIAAFAPPVRWMHQFKSRKAGSFRFVEFHVLVDAVMSIDESHRIADVISCSIKQRYPGTTVTIHMEPCSCIKAKEEQCGCFNKRRSQEITRIGGG
jgi:cation diffusion facilitator family transporter